MMRKDEEEETEQILLHVQPEPLAFIFEKENGRTVTMPLAAEDALRLVLQLMDCPPVRKSVRAPRILGRVMAWALSGAINSNRQW